jgi:hypothetical protein
MEALWKRLVEPDAGGEEAFLTELARFIQQLMFDLAHANSVNEIDSKCRVSGRAVIAHGTKFVQELEKYVEHDYDVSCSVICEDMKGRLGHSSMWHMPSRQNEFLEADGTRLARILAADQQRMGASKIT